MDIAMLWGCVAALCLVLPLAWKWQLGIRRVGLFVVVTGILCSAIITLAAPAWSFSVAVFAIAAMTLILSAGFLAYRFLS